MYEFTIFKEQTPVFSERECVTEVSDGCPAWKNIQLLINCSLISNFDLEAILSLIRIKFIASTQIY